MREIDFYVQFSGEINAVYNFIARESYNITY